MKSDEHDTISLEQRKRRLIEQARPMMGAEGASRLAGLLRPGAALRMRVPAQPTAPADPDLALLRAQMERVAAVCGIEAG